MRRVRVIERADEMRAVAALWRELYASQRDATFFQRFELNEISARNFAHREHPYVVIAESDSGAAMIPACVSRDHVSFLGEELFDYRSPLATDGQMLECAWQEIDRLGLPLRVQATRAHVEWGDTRPFAGAPWLPASQVLTRSKKHERNLRLLRERGCVITQYRRDTAKFDERVRCLYRLKGKTERGSLFSDPLRVDAVSEMAASVESELFTIEKDGEFVASILTLIDGSTCRFYGTYYDVRWAVFSPGISLLYKVIRNAQQRGHDFDFMTGEQAYKMRFATEVMPLYIAERRAAASLAA